MTHLIYMWDLFRCEDPHEAFLRGVECAIVLCMEHSENGGAAALRAELETAKIAQQVLDQVGR